MRKNLALNKEEEQLANDFADGLFERVSDTHDYVEIAKKTQDSRINLRLREDVLLFFKKRAEVEGIPCQTLINSTLFKVATGRMVEKGLIDEPPSSSSKDTQLNVS